MCGEESEPVQELRSPRTLVWSTGDGSFSSSLPLGVSVRDIMGVSVGVAGSDGSGV